MAERSSVDSAMDVSSVTEDNLVVEVLERVPGPYDSNLDDDDFLMRMAAKYGNIQAPTLPQSRMQSGFQFAPPADDKEPILWDCTTKNELGIVELDIKKLERKVSLLSLGEATTTDNLTQKENDVKFLREQVKAFIESLDEEENSSDQTEQEDKDSVEEQMTEKLTPFKYEREENKLWHRKQHLKQVCKVFLVHNCSRVNLTEGAQETFSKGLIDHVESDLQPAVNILRRTAYQKLCKKHFSAKFPSGAFVEQDEPVENISISVEHFEFLHKASSKKFSELCKCKDLEKTPQINEIVPPLVKFLKKRNNIIFAKDCLTLILAILKNPYRKLEFFFDVNEQNIAHPVVNEQRVIAEYFLKCLQIPEILNDKNVYEKLAEAITRFAKIHTSFLAYIVAVFQASLNNKEDDEYAYQIYCKVLNLMTSIGETIINLCLPEYFRKIACLVSNDRSCDLYFHLLKACEISIANAIEHESQLQMKLVTFYADCYNYFGRDLTTRLIPVFKKYEKRKNRTEQALSKQHGVLPTKDGYMNIEMRFLSNRNKIRSNAEPLNIPRVKESAFVTEGKVLFGSNKQFGYVFERDIMTFSSEDKSYWDCIHEFPVSYLNSLNNQVF